MIECRIAKDTLTLTEYPPCSDGVAEDAKKGCNQTSMVQCLSRDLHEIVITV